MQLIIQVVRPVKYLYKHVCLSASFEMGTVKWRAQNQLNNNFTQT